jgi:hypothetical protein
MMGAYVVYACGSSISVSTTTGNWYIPLTGTSGVDFVARYWQTNTTTNNSGTQPTCGSTGCPNNDGGGILWDLNNDGNLVWWADWGNPTSVGNCPTSSDQTTGLIEYRLNEGSATHKGQFALMTGDWNGSQFNMDVGPAGAVAMTDIPVPYISGSSVGSTYWDLTVTSFAPANLKGVYTTDPGNIVTGVKFYYYQGASAPTTSTPASWTAVPQVNGGAGNQVTWGSSPAPASIVVSVPKVANGGNTTWIAETLLFGNNTTPAAFESKFTSGNSVAIGPTASPLFANVTADPTTVAWTSGDESRVASYQAYMSLTANGTYRAIGQPVAALGSGHSYTVNYRVVAPTYYVKIKASKTDGTFVWSSAVKVTRLAPAPKPLPGKAGLRK